MGKPEFSDLLNHPQAIKEIAEIYEKIEIKNNAKIKPSKMIQAAYAIWKETKEIEVDQTKRWIEIIDESNLENLKIEKKHNLAKEIYVNLLTDFYRSYRDGNLWEFGAEDYQKPDHAKIKAAAFQAAEDFYKI